jgi:Lectin C-type domain
MKTTNVIIPLLFTFLNLTLTFASNILKQEHRLLQSTNDDLFCSRLDLNPGNSHLYGRYQTQQAFDFFGAQSSVANLPTCCGKKAHLVTIGDSMENAFVERVVKGLNQKSWIGLSDRLSQEGDFKWVDGTPRNFTKWRTGEPNDAGDGEDCVVFFEDGTSWNDEACSVYIPTYVFEYDCDSFCSNLALNPTNNHLYGRHLVPMDWTYARISAQLLPTCCGKKAHLVTIGDSTENAFVEKIVQGLDRQWWIGLSDQLTEGKYDWIDSTPVNFSKWRPGEPNNFGGNEDCVEFIQSGTGITWNDLPCTNIRSNYLFEYDCVLTKSPTAFPVRPPTQKPTYVPISFNGTKFSWVCPNSTAFDLVPWQNYSKTSLGRCTSILFTFRTNVPIEYVYYTFPGYSYFKHTRTLSASFTATYFSTTGGKSIQFRGESDGQSGRRMLPQGTLSFGLIP